MDRRSAYVLLAVIGVGVFLAGLELMVTAVALPSILADLADPNSGSAWIELRKASWIINGYLLVYILTMPMAGRLADLWGVRRLFMGALVVFTFGSRWPVPPSRSTSSSRRGSSRRSVAACSSRSGRPPPRICSVARCVRGRWGVVGALTFLGMAAGPVVGAAIIGSVHPEVALAAAGAGDAAISVLSPPGAGCSTSTSRSVSSR